MTITQRNHFMLVEDAIEIVMELANMGLEADTLALIGRDETGEQGNRLLSEMKKRQELAIETIEDFFVNVVFEDLHS